ncbi:polysaccharide lyase 8 family protein [Streptomyces genisteinicus]|uniref:Polysaccharide lyase 8 family protein n=1 Tax=Streptomyces genisteinicus TaxID=2768068 RepID=A0A7H0I1U6_9ACTN|nr:polysaccharide lyase 8 family protein [Streptomyces genisteinicus]QNP66762.1 polysaccharide lyase 8 family protein [Streptomyces genisteinicus]
MTPSWTRRGVLHAAGGAALALGTAGPAAAAPQTPAATAPRAAADDFAALRAVWRDLVLGTGFSPTAEPFATRLRELGTEAAAHLAAMAPAAGSLWPDLPLADPEPDKDTESYGYSARLVDSYTRLRTMAEAHVRAGTGLTGDAALATGILTGLDHLHDLAYNAAQPPYGNWWSWQIGAPQRLLDLCVLMYDRIRADRLAAYCAAVDHFVPDSAVASYTGTSTGANRVDLCRVLALRGVVGQDPAKTALARDALSPVFPYVTTGDGLYTDGSFVQHTYVPYTGSYGAVMLGGIGLLLALLAGSPWAVTDPARQIVLDAVEHAWAPFIHNGLVMDGVSGRGISRGVMLSDPRGIQQDDHTRGHGILASVVLLAEGASGAERTRWRGLVKGWMRRAYYSPVLEDRTLSLASLAWLAGVENDAAVPAAAHPSGHRLFASMDRAVHRRPTWTASVSMASRRITHYETGNTENLRGWHTGSGMLYWWGDDYANGQYSDAFWATVDPYRLPGTTTSAKRLADAAGGDWGASRPAADWVGGATDGTVAGVGQHLKGLGSTLEARKSWFFVGDTVVCLGAGITCTDGTAVESVIDNRNLGAAGVHPLTVDGVTAPAALPWSAPLTGARWAHLGGFGGYVLGGTTGVRALREQRTGRWSDINKTCATTPLTRRWLTLFADHGTDPVNASYAYQMLPGADAARTAARSADASWMQMLANTGQAQGVRVPSAGFTAANFFAAGTAGALTASAPCAVLVRERGDGTAVVCVADPARQAASLTVTWNRPVAAVVSRPATVTSAVTGGSLRLAFGSLTGAAGATQKTVVRLG